MSNEPERGGFADRLWSNATKDRTQRQEAAHVASKVVPLHPDRTYVAQELRDHALRLHIRCAAQPSQYPAYSSLLNIIYDHDFESGFTLVYSFMVVEVTGQHLSAIVHAISFGDCGRITEFHRKLHDPPASGEPIIESIEIISAVTNGKPPEAQKS